MKRFLATIALSSALSLIGKSNLYAQGLPTATYKVGEILWETNQFGHRNTPYMGGWVYIPWPTVKILDISNPRSPRIIDGPRMEVCNTHNSWYVNGRYYQRENLSGNKVEISDGNYVDILALPRVVTRTLPGLPSGSGYADHYWSANIFPHKLDDGVLRRQSTLSGSRPDNLHVVGNLVMIGFYGDTPGGSIASWDIGDPDRPKLLDVVTRPWTNYSTPKKMYGTNIIFTQFTNGVSPLRSIDFSDPTDLKDGIMIPEWAGRYFQNQDEFGFGCFGRRCKKFNLDTGKLVAEFSAGNNPYDFSWMPIGNLLLGSGTHQEPNDGYTTIIAHQSEPDTRAPSIAFTYPRDGAVNLPVTSRFGVMIHETLDPVTVNSDTVKLRAIGGATVETMLIYNDYGVININPVQPLLPNTTYELQFVGGGVKDAAKNGIGGRSFLFSTGASITRPSATPSPTPTLIPPTPNPTATPVMVATIIPTATATATAIPTLNASLTLTPQQLVIQRIIRLCTAFVKSSSPAISSQKRTRLRAALRQQRSLTPEQRAKIVAQCKMLLARRR
jgi:large repetitive protein